MKKETNFSVIIPVYNKGPHIARSIQSVVNQTYKDFELIIVDDSSTDDSLEKINSFKDERIRVLQRKTPGPGGYAARNFGIRTARSEWVAFLDADDVWSDAHLETINKLIVKFPHVGICSTGWNIVGDDTAVENSFYRKFKTKGDLEYGLDFYISNPRAVHTSVVVARKDLLMNLGGFDESWRHGADVELWLRIFLSGAKGAWGDSLTGSYHVNSVNMVTKNLSQIVSPSSIAIKRFLKNNSKHPLAQELIKYANKQNFTPFLRGVLSRKLSFREMREGFSLNCFVDPKTTLIVYIIMVMPFSLRKAFVNNFF